MKQLSYAFATLAVATLSPGISSAADLDGYYQRDTYIERPARIIERERVVEHHHHHYQAAPVYTERRVYTEPRYYAPRVYHEESYDRPRFGYAHAGWWRPRHFFPRGHYWPRHHHHRGW